MDPKKISSNQWVSKNPITWEIHTEFEKVCKEIIDTNDLTLLKNSVKNDSIIKTRPFTPGIFDIHLFDEIFLGSNPIN